MQGCVCPHPPLLIPEVGGDARAKVEATLDAMARLSREVGEPETIVIISPHSPGYSDAHVVKVAAHLRGDFGGFGCPQVTLSFENDLPFAQLLLALGGSEGAVRLESSTDGLLDHGVLVPLSFLKAGQIVSLSVAQPYGEHRALGRLVRRCAEELGRDTLFVASGDLSHRLIRSAPAGYDPRGKEFDRLLVDLLSVGDFAALSSLERGLVQGAGECGLRSLIALGGFLGDDAQKRPEVLSYEGPFGVGYMVARFGESAGARATATL
jgi:aromatic ring-opening dioxygenase LigB subunit